MNRFCKCINKAATRWWAEALWFVSAALGSSMMVSYWSTKKVFGAQWWELMTAFGTVGAVVATLGHHWYRQRREREQLVILANLAAPVIRAKLIDLGSQTQQMSIARRALIASFSKDVEERARMADWAETMQKSFTESEMTYLAKFSLTAAVNISAANADLEHFKFYLGQPPLRGRDYCSELLDLALDQIDSARKAYEEAYKEMRGWRGWK